MDDSVLLKKKSFLPKEQADRLSRQVKELKGVQYRVSVNFIRNEYLQVRVGIRTKRATRECSEVCFLYSKDHPRQPHLHLLVDYNVSTLFQDYSEKLAKKGATLLCMVRQLQVTLYKDQLAGRYCISDCFSNQLLSDGLPYKVFQGDLALQHFASCPVGFLSDGSCWLFFRLQGAAILHDVIPIKAGSVEAKEGCLHFKGRLSQFSIKVDRPSSFLAFAQQELERLGGKRIDDIRREVDALEGKAVLEDTEMHQLLKGYKGLIESYSKADNVSHQPYLQKLQLLIQKMAG